MTPVSRSQVLSSLQNDWGSILEKFHALPGSAQKTYLDMQGYVAFGGLLAHVIFWWQVVIADVSYTLENPAYLRPQRDCDACNAEAVMAVRDLDERAVERSFQNMLAAMIDFIQTLPEEVFANEVLATWIDDNVGGHYQEHEIR